MTPWLSISVCRFPGELASDSCSAPFCQRYRHRHRRRTKRQVTSAWTFIRALAGCRVCPLRVRSFNQYTKQFASVIEDPMVREQFTNGTAFNLATKAFVNSLSPAVRGQVQEVFDITPIRVMRIGIGFVGTGFILSFSRKMSS